MTTGATVSKEDCVANLNLVLTDESVVDVSTDENCFVKRSTTESERPVCGVVAVNSTFVLTLPLTPKGIDESADVHQCGIVLCTLH